jgi:hypothetical protein
MAATMRQRLAIALRERGMTFREIAERMSESTPISGGGARDAYVSGLRKRDAIEPKPSGRARRR